MEQKQYNEPPKLKVFWASTAQCYANMEFNTFLNPISESTQILIREPDQNASEDRQYITVMKAFKDGVKLPQDNLSELEDFPPDSFQYFFYEFTKNNDIETTYGKKYQTIFLTQLLINYMQSETFQSDDLEWIKGEFKSLKNALVPQLNFMQDLKTAAERPSFYILSWCLTVGAFFLAKDYYDQSTSANTRSLYEELQSRTNRTESKDLWQKAIDGSDAKYKTNTYIISAGTALIMAIVFITFYANRDLSDLVYRNQLKGSKSYHFWERIRNKIDPEVQTLISYLDAKINDLESTLPKKFKPD